LKKEPGGRLRSGNFEFAGLLAPNDFAAVSQTAPYFDLPSWNPRGECAKKLRANVNQSVPGRVEIEEARVVDGKLRSETAQLCLSWWTRVARHGIRMARGARSISHLAHRGYACARQWQTGWLSFR
jgi:hypothetical protein